MDDYDEVGEPMFKVLLPASEIPINSTVTKKTGEKEYRLLDSIKIYNEKGEPQVIKGEGVLYLVDGDSINAISGDKVLGWQIEEADLLGFLQLREDARNSR
jgi:hypothetical protein